MLAVYLPSRNADRTRAAGTNGDDDVGNDKPALIVRRVKDAQSAIDFAYTNYGVNAYAFLGYNMMTAGLTLQHRITTEERVLHFCCRYMAFAATSDKPLDESLQLVGRAFVDLKEFRAPLGWRIQMLGVRKVVDTLLQYATLERKFAEAKTTKPAATRRPGRVQGMPIYEVLRSAFGLTFMVDNNLNSIGYIGKRGKTGDFGGILGYTAQKAKALAKKAERARQLVKQGGLTEDAAATQLRQEQAAEDAAENQRITRQGERALELQRERPDLIVGGNNAEAGPSGAAPGGGN